MDLAVTVLLRGSNTNFGSLDLIKIDEKHIKMIILTLLRVDDTYFIQS